MSKIKNLVIAGVAGAAIIGGGTIYALSGGSKNLDKELSIGISSSELPYYNFVKDELKKKDITLNIKSFDDYVQPNLAVGNDTLDINAFQHVPYLNEFKKSHKDNKGVQEIKQLDKTIVSPLRLYSNKHKQFADLSKTKTITIAVPNDPTNEARALHLLESKGLLKLNNDTLKATKHDVVKVPGYNVILKELDAAQTPKVLNEVDGSVINGNYAKTNNVSLDKAIITESETVYHTFDNIVAGKEGVSKSKSYKAFKEILKSEKSEEKRKELNKYDLVLK